MKFRSCFGLSMALWVGCASAPRAEDSIRVVHDPELVHGCRSVGTVEAVNSTSGAKNRSYYESVEARRDSKNQNAWLRRQAAKVGADVVLVTDEKVDRVIGEAYRCGEPH
jgi:hypothetical protein